LGQPHRSGGVLDGTAVHGDSGDLEEYAVSDTVERFPVSATRRWHPDEPVVKAADHDAAMAECERLAAHAQRVALERRDYWFAKCEAAETALAEAKRLVASQLIQITVLADRAERLRAENDRQERLIQDYMMSQGAFPMAVSRIVTAPTDEDLEALGFIAFRKAQNGLHAHEGAAFASQFLAAIADVAKARASESGGA
jgi:hypothetical protein